MTLKPIVHGLEQKSRGKLRAIRLDFLGPVGRIAAKRYGLWMIPTLILFDEQGQEINRQLELLSAEDIKRYLRNFS